jgi:hypothetical protein
MLGATAYSAASILLAPSKVGAMVLPPGLYKVKLQGAPVLLTDVDSKKSDSALVRMEKTEKRSTFTAAQARLVDRIQQIDAIVLSGADYKLLF